MGKNNKLNRWQLVLCGLIGLFLAYGLGSLAFDSGSWWHYFGTLTLLIISVRLLMRGTKTVK